MRILDKYIFRSLIVIAVFCVLLFFMLYILIDGFSNLDEMLDRKVTFDTMVEYYLTFLPVIFVQTAPIACLVAGLLVLSNMNINNEIIAMRTAGMHFWQITRVPVTFGIFISVLILAVNELVVPNATVISDKIKAEKMVYIIQRDKPRLVHNLTFFGLKNRLYFFSTFDPQEKTMEGITILEQDNRQNLRKKIVALKGEWHRNKWVFYQTQIMNFDASGQMAEGVEFFEEKIMDIQETPTDFMRQRVQISGMNIRQLNDYISRFKYSGAVAALRNLRVDLHQKIAYPFSNIVILLVGLPFGLMTKKRKGVAFASLGLCLTIGFLYYVTNAVSLALGKGGVLFPIAAAWMPNIMFALFARYLIKRVY